jgi:hypothetical protein
MKYDVILATTTGVVTTTVEIEGVPVPTRLQHTNLSQFGNGYFDQDKIIAIVPSKGLNPASFPGTRSSVTG